MPKSQLETFTDRREAIALFDHLRGPKPDITWPLLPILAFVAPGGSGKSTLINYLRINKCCLPDGRAALPYAHLDFTLASTPKDLLSILITLRDQLQQHHDGRDKHLTFPRFDLGALIAQSALTNADLSSFGPNEIRRKLSTGKQVFEALTKLGSSLGYTVPLVAPLLAGLHLAGQIKPVNDLLSYLEDATGWKWYRRHGTATGLGANASLKEVLLRLHVLSLPVYLSMILGANFSPESGPEIPLNVSLLLRFGGHVTTKKWTTWLFANEKESHRGQVSPPPCSNGVAQTVPETFLPPRVQRLSPSLAACPTSAAARYRVPDSRCGLLLQSHAKSRPRRRKWGGVRARSSWP
jgi:hypothetical protein